MLYNPEKVTGKPPYILSKRKDVAFFLLVCDWSDSLRGPRPWGLEQGRVEFVSMYPQVPTLNGIPDSNSPVQEMAHHAHSIHPRWNFEATDDAI
jgi:hypothetical protein